MKLLLSLPPVLVLNYRNLLNVNIFYLHDITDSLGTCEPMKGGCELLPLSDYDSKSRTSLAYCTEDSIDHLESAAQSGHLLRTSDQATMYLPSPYALSRIISVYESSDLPPPPSSHDSSTPTNHATLSKPSSCLSSSPLHSRGGGGHRTSSTLRNSHHQQQQNQGNRRHSNQNNSSQHYDVPFKQVSPKRREYYPSINCHLEGMFPSLTINEFLFFRFCRLFTD